MDADPAGVAGLRVLDEERFSYDVHVDHEVLRGSGRPAPEALAGLLGLQPGRSLHFSARDADRTTTGLVVVGWSRTSHMCPYLGRVWAQALHDGAEDGDVLRLTFDPVSMVVRHERVMSQTFQWARLDPWMHAVRDVVERLAIVTNYRLIRGVQLRRAPFPNRGNESGFREFAAGK